MLKGKAQPIVVYELSSRIDEVDENRKESARFFLMLMPLSENSPGWSKEKFHRLSEISATEGPSTKFCDEFKKTSPGETWDGVIALDEK